jgi:hypothetical protein
MTVTAWVWIRPANLHAYDVASVVAWGELEVAVKESELVGDDCLVLWAVVDVEVVDARVVAQLAVRGALRGVDRWLGFGHLVISADADQPGAVQRGGVADRADGGPNSQAAETRLRQRESSPIATTCRQPASAPGARMNAGSCGWPTAGR